jgi:Zn-dependent protease with chaperone function
MLHDGVTALPRPVRAQLLPDVLRITAADGVTQDWPVGTLREVDRMPWEMRLASGACPQRLVVGDPALMTALDAAMEPARIAAWWRLRNRAMLTALAVPVLGAALWFGWPPLADALARATPAVWEERLGDAVAASLSHGLARCTAPDGVAALDRLGARLAEAGGLAGAPAVQVVDSGLVNAFAAPGRQVIVHRGLIAAAKSPDEVAGVLAHEFGHLHHRHGIRNVARAIGVGAIVSVLIGGSDFGVVAATMLVGFSYTRGFEQEADDFAGDVLRRTGIGVEGLAAFFQRAAEPGPRGGGSYLDTHPASDQRAARLRAGGGPAAPASAMTPQEWSALRGICGTTAPPGRAP